MRFFFILEKQLNHPVVRYHILSNLSLHYHLPSVNLSCTSVCSMRFPLSKTTGRRKETVLRLGWGNVRCSFSFCFLVFSKLSTMSMDCFCLPTFVICISWAHKDFACGYFISQGQMIIYLLFSGIPELSLVFGHVLW